MQALYARPMPESPGKIPDVQAPLDLPRLVMRRALAVALGCLALSLVLGLLRLRADTQQEMQGSWASAAVSRELALLSARDAADALASLRALQGLRHLELELRDGHGRPLLRLPDTAASVQAPEAAAPAHARGTTPATPGKPPASDEAALASNMTAGLPGTPASAAWPPPVWTRVSRHLGLPPERRSVSWTVPRPDGDTWTVQLTTSPRSEMREALSGLADLFLLLAACSALMLAVMHWNVRRAFVPLQALLAAIARVERQDLRAVRGLPTMPTRELEAISQALKHLAAAQERAEGARRVLGHRLLSLQEDERQRLARDLHDEFGQHLTALRVDAAWLGRRLESRPELQTVAAGMDRQVALVQDGVRRLLARLRPTGPAGVRARGAPPTLGRLRLMLQDLVDGWTTGAQGRGTRFGLQVDADDALPLPEDLVLGAYRISQEALTNVTRHAGARTARLALRIEGATDAGGVLVWSVRDDGRGLGDIEAALQRGTGLAGIKERVWALGGELEASPGGPCASGDADAMPGLELRARLPYAAARVPGEAS